MRLLTVLENAPRSFRGSRPVPSVQGLGWSAPCATGCLVADPEPIWLCERSLGHLGFFVTDGEETELYPQGWKHMHKCQRLSMFLNLNDGDSICSQVGVYSLKAIANLRGQVNSSTVHCQERNRLCFHMTKQAKSRHLKVQFDRSSRVHIRPGLISQHRT